MKENKIAMYCKRKLPAILAITSALSSLAALYFTGRATAKAVREYDALKNEGVKLEQKEIIKKFVPYYIPAIGFATASIACNVAGNVIHVKHNRALSLAATSAMETLQDFKRKARTIAGDDKVNLIEEQRAKEAALVERVSSSSKVRVYDEFTGVKFETTWEKLKDAEAEVNRQINSVCWGKCEAELKDFYRLLGIDLSIAKPIFNDNYIWHQEYMIEMWELSYIDFFDKETAMDEDGTEIVMLRYFPEPEPDLKIRTYYDEGM